ncbi:hypothetical protein FA13DRAFT_1894028 [Coprinellus micaceus]|uniref:Uncharacterized protein n=1 Tax=Coprinellus micaceus TaxID=71717 RepID=A0A4Y7SWA5_COPMI|nr:hypothetical protein FA13DRAFT_1894028 [Coprinellus micaceus]
MELGNKRSEGVLIAPPEPSCGRTRCDATSPHCQAALPDPGQLSLRIGGEFLRLWGGGSTLRGRFAIPVPPLELSILSASCAGDPTSVRNLRLLCGQPGAYQIHTRPTRPFTTRLRPEVGGPRPLAPSLRTSVRRRGVPPTSLTTHMFLERTVARRPSLPVASRLPSFHMSGLLRLWWRVSLAPREAHYKPGYRLPLPPPLSEPLANVKLDDSNIRHGASLPFSLGTLVSGSVDNVRLFVGALRSWPRPLRCSGARCGDRLDTQVIPDAESINGDYAPSEVSYLGAPIPSLPRSNQPLTVLHGEATRPGSFRDVPWSKHDRLTEVQGCRIFLGPFCIAVAATSGRGGRVPSTTHASVLYQIFKPSVIHFLSKRSEVTVNHRKYLEKAPRDKNAGPPLSTEHRPTSEVEVDAAVVIQMDIVLSVFE